MSTKSIFDLPEIKPYREAWDARQRELVYRGSYYDGSAYRNNNLMWVLGPRLSKEIRPLFLPLSRAVDIDAGIIGGGWEFAPDEPKYEQWTQARDVLFDMSQWDTNGVLFVHYGAKYGVSGLRVSDLQDERRVVVQPVDPLRYMLIYNRAYSDAPDMALWVEMRNDGDEYEYAEIITPDSIRTFRNGEPFGYDGRDAEYPNVQGIVPIFECLHINDGTQLGECTYQRVIPLLDELNQTASRLATIIQHHAEPQSVITGAEPAELVRSGDVMWFLPDGATAEFLVPSIDIAGVLEFIREIKQGVHDGLAELAFDEVRKNGQIATATLEIQLTELVLKIKRIRPNYDRCLVRAMQAAGAAGEAMGLAELAPLNDVELQFDQSRPVLPQNPADAIRLEMLRIELEQMRSGAGNNEGVNA